MNNLIFGRTWETIQAMQQKKPYGETIDTSKPAPIPELTEDDLRLYRDHGI